MRSPRDFYALRRLIFGRKAKEEYLCGKGK